MVFFFDKKISLASEKRIRGVLIYSDPMDYQTSDIITRHYIESWLRLNKNNSMSIPCLMIDYEDAAILLRCELHTIDSNDPSASKI